MNDIQRDMALEIMMGRMGYELKGDAWNKRAKKPQDITDPGEYASENMILVYLSRMTGKVYGAFRGSKPTNHAMLVKSLLVDYSEEEIKLVIHSKCADWLADPVMNQYLRPSTLFRRSKFEQYLVDAKSKRHVIEYDKNAANEVLSELMK